MPPATEFATTALRLNLIATLGLWDGIPVGIPAGHCSFEFLLFVISSILGGYACEL